jgi:hypothetical protein
LAWVFAPPEVTVPVYNTQGIGPTSWTNPTSAAGFGQMLRSGSLTMPICVIEAGCYLPANDRQTDTLFDLDHPVLQAELIQPAIRVGRQPGSLRDKITTLIGLVRAHVGAHSGNDLRAYVNSNSYTETMAASWRSGEATKASDIWCGGRASCAEQNAFLVAALHAAGIPCTLVPSDMYTAAEAAARRRGDSVIAKYGHMPCAVMVAENDWALADATNPQYNGVPLDVEVPLAGGYCLVPHPEGIAISRQRTMRQFVDLR